MAKIKGISIEKMETLRIKYEGEMGRVASLVQPFCDFECSVGHQAADGFVLESAVEGMDIAPLSSCLRIIDRKGRLSYEDFKQSCI